MRMMQIVWLRGMFPRMPQFLSAMDTNANHVNDNNPKEHGHDKAPTDHPRI